MVASMHLESAQYTCAYDSRVEKIRDDEYPVIKDKVYLDHAGTTLYSKSLIEAFSRDLVTNLYGNPHSDSTPSALAGFRVEEVRRQTLEFFKADPAHFDLIFVANATAAIRLVAECIRDYHDISSPGRELEGFWYGYHRDAHTSLVGVRELTNGHHRCFQNDCEVTRWIKDSQSNVGESVLGLREPQIGLFAYPGQSNMTGRRLPLEWPGRIRRTFGSRIYTLLDAAALATTAPIDLHDEKEAPDFTAVSFYKIFGFPNIGALIVRRAAGNVLQNRKYFGGGTVDMVISLGDTWHKKKDTALHDELEEGTLPFLSIIALGHALDVHQRLFESMSRTSKHTAFLAKRLFDGLSGLIHANGFPVCRIYKDAEAVYGDPKTQGATIAFNILSPDGLMIPYDQVEQLADKRGIYLRSGSLCNPGGVAAYLGFTATDLRAAFAAGHRCSHPLVSTQGKSTGVVRASLGAMSTIADVDSLLQYLKETYIVQASKEATSQGTVVKFSSDSCVTETSSLRKIVTRTGRLPRLRPTTRRWIEKIVKPFSSRKQFQTVTL